MLWVFLVVALGAPTQVHAAKLGAPKSSATEDTGAELFLAFARGDIEVKFTPFDSKMANVSIENKTKKPLKIQLPDAFAAVPIVAQFRDRGDLGSGQGFGGLGCGAVGFINVAPKKVGQVNVMTVCLEIDKSGANPRIEYEIRPIESLTDKPEVIELCKMLGSSSIEQHAVQAAAWHLAHDISWEKLSRKVGKRRIGTVEPYFSPQHIALGARIAGEAIRLAKPQDASTRGTQVSMSYDDSLGLFQTGLKQAEEFRRSLLARDTNEVSDAELIGQALERFLATCPTSIRRRANLDDIQIPSYRFLQQLRGEACVDEFGMTEGYTYGHTDSPTHEHHHWHRVETFQPALQIESTLPPVVAAQYDQTNNGFGWNYLVAQSDYSSHQTILGIFYMMDLSDPQTIRLGRPHVGYSGGEGLSVWVSPTEVYIERSLKSDIANSERIVVTGFSYVIQSGRLRNQGRGFQVVFEREPNDHLQSSRFRISLRTP